MKISFIAFLFTEINVYILIAATICITIPTSNTMSIKAVV